MPQPSTVLREVSAAASSSWAKPSRSSLNPMGRNIAKFRPGSEPSKAEFNQRIHHFILAEIPKSATSQDVLRALKQNNIVQKDFPVSNLTMPPPACPRGATQTKNVHLTLQDLDFEQARHANQALVSRPLFPDTSSWAQGSRPATNLGMRSHLPAYPININAHQWVSRQLSTLMRTDSAENPRISEAGWNSENSKVKAPVPSTEWCMDRNYRGRRVLLRGLPGMVPEYRIRQAGATYGVEPKPTGLEAADDVKRLPGSVASYTSTWVVTTDSVNNACRLVRRWNKQYWGREQMGERYLVRAEIIW